MLLRVSLAHAVQAWRWDIYGPREGDISIGLGPRIRAQDRGIYRPGVYMGAILSLSICIYPKYIFVASFYPHSSIIMHP
jgi:hypothetical protein